MTLPVAAAVAVAKASFTSSSHRGEPSADRSEISTVFPALSVTGAPLFGPSNRRPTAAIGTPVPVSDADGRMAVMTSLGRSAAMSSAVVNRASVPDGHRNACAKAVMPKYRSRRASIASVRAVRRSARCRGDGAWIVSKKAAAALSNPATEIGDAVHDDIQTKSGVGTAGQRYLFRPVFRSNAIRLSPPANRAGTKPPKWSIGGRRSGLRRQDLASVSDRSVGINIHPAFLSRRGLC